MSKRLTRVFQSISQIEFVALSLVFALALILRTLRLDLMEFKHDEAVAWIRSLAFIRGVQFPAVGLMSSKGIDNFPLFLYILGFFQTILQRPETLVWFIALLNSLAVLPIFYTTRILFNRRTAWIAVLLYTTSPCAILFSRKLWAQDLLPFWASVLFFCATMIVTRHQRKSSCVFLFALFAATIWQIHFAGLFLLPAYLCVAILFRKALTRGDIVPVVGGIMLGLVPAIPWFVHWITGDSPFKAANSMSFKWHLHVEELVFYYVRQPIDENINRLLGQEYYYFMHGITGYNTIRHILSAMVVGGIFICTFVALRNRNAVYANSNYMAENKTNEITCKDPSVLMLYITYIPLGIIALSGISLIPAYFMIFYPLPFIYLALAIVMARQVLSSIFGQSVARIFTILALNLIIGYHIYYFASFLQRIQREGGTRGEYGIAWKEIPGTEDAVEKVVDIIQGSHAQYIVLDKQSWGISTELQKNEAFRALELGKQLLRESAVK